MLFKILLLMSTNTQKTISNLLNIMFNKGVIRKLEYE